VCDSDGKILIDQTEFLKFQFGRRSTRQNVNYAVSTSLEKETVLRTHWNSTSLYLCRHIRQWCNPDK